jgi:hypothetical protein
MFRSNLHKITMSHVLWTWSSVLHSRKKPDYKAFEDKRTISKVRGLTLLLRVGNLWRCGDGLFFEVSLFASNALLTMLHQLLEKVLQTVDHFYISCLAAPFSWSEEPRNRMGARSGLYGWCSNGVPPISVSASIATFQSRNADAPLKLIRHPKKGSFKTTVIPFSRSGWSVVRSTPLSKGGTSKKVWSPHLHKVPTRSNKVSPRTSQTALVFSSFVYIMFAVSKAWHV